MTWTLLAFGWAFIIFGVLAVVIPFARRRSDLLTSFNIFMLGAVNFIGIASIRAADPEMGGRYYEDSDIPKFLLGAVVFFIALFVGYYAMARPPRAIAGRIWKKWPPDTDFALAIMMAPLAILSLGLLFPPRIQFIGQNTAFMANVSSYLLAAFAMVLWLRKKRSLIRLVLLAGVTAYVGLLSISTGSSRRELVDLMLVFLVIPYWMIFRYRVSRSYIWKLLTVSAVCFVFVSGYNEIRHRKSQNFSVSYALKSLSMLPTAFANFGAQETESMASGDGAVECSLAAIHWYTYDAQTLPFFTIRFILANPIPRAWWPDKPEALGSSLPRDVGQIRQFGEINWGPGIVGHCYQEGGVLFAVFYGILFGLGLRFVDEQLMRQADNPYVLGIFCACSANIVALSRGDIGVFLMDIIGFVIFGLLIARIARVFLGTELIYPTDQQLAEMQEYESTHGEAAPAAAWGAQSVN